MPFGKGNAGGAPYVPEQSAKLPEGLVENMSNFSTVGPLPPNTTVMPTEIPIRQQPCQWILYTEINGSRVRIWDLIILLPNVMFLLFLLLRVQTTIAKLRRTNSPIFFAFYGMVFLVAVISILRCVVAMTVNAAVTAGDIADKVLWLILRFFLLATELSVVIFGLAFGHLDSSTSIKRVLLVTTLIALAYSCTQGALEFMYPDDRFHVIHGDREYDIFGHGGMMFWFASSIFFFCVYSVICVLPFTRMRERFALPTKKSFYWYCCLMACLNLTQGVGSGLLYYNVANGMCVVDITTYLYFTCFAPLVYGTFLRDFFSTSQPPNILFSYKAQQDEEEDTVHLPHQSYAPKPDFSITGSAVGTTTAENNNPMSASFDSTHFDSAMSPNPLYSHVGVNAELSMNSDYYGYEDEDGRRRLSHSKEMRHVVS